MRRPRQPQRFLLRRKAFSWNLDELKKLDDEHEARLEDLESKYGHGIYHSGSTKFKWMVYDDARGDPTNLQDKEKLFEVMCYARANSGLNGGTAIYTLSTDSPYLSQQTTYTANVAAVVCSESRCVAPDGCDGQELPKWDTPEA
ncbi:hypothetical protein I316_04324 [Kwoniella heveanensis BCC8398]|uniref:Uncharacterized protein n=1 Tax=Kwoniella heveanensis BCC8398 TaxID=1296120 RepID=A0A1B9GSN4_9TREE|nr:hypothetical protein I316_04324 [Kwoniella heveanensis BCC8398]